MHEWYGIRKYNALTHPYPSIKDKIEKYGYDNKQFHHILRLTEFIQRYVNNEPYKDILIPNDKEILLRVKREYTHSLEDAKNLSKYSCEYIKEVKDKYMSENELIIDYEVEEIMNSVLLSTISHSIRKEIL